MAITINGTRLTHFEIQSKSGEVKVEGKYELISNTDQVLAKQGFNGYDQKALRELELIEFNAAEVLGAS